MGLREEWKLRARRKGELGESFRVGTDGDARRPSSMKAWEDGGGTWGLGRSSSKGGEWPGGRPPSHFHVRLHPLPPPMPVWDGSKRTTLSSGGRRGLLTGGGRTLQIPVRSAMGRILWIKPKGSANSSQVGSKTGHSGGGRNSAMAGRTDTSDSGNRSEQSPNSQSVDEHL